LGAAEHLRIDDVRDDGLIFAGKVFVQQFREAVARDFFVICRGFEVSDGFLLELETQNIVARSGRACG
jgi:hypothetical protein